MNKVKIKTKKLETLWIRIDCVFTVQKHTNTHSNNTKKNTHIYEWQSKMTAIMQKCMPPCRTDVETRFLRIRQALFSKFFNSHEWIAAYGAASHKYCATNTAKYSTAFRKWNSNYYIIAAVAAASEATNA